MPDIETGLAHSRDAYRAMSVEKLSKQQCDVIAAFKELRAAGQRRCLYMDVWRHMVRSNPELRQTSVNARIGELVSAGALAVEGDMGRKGRLFALVAQQQALSGVQ